MVIYETEITFDITFHEMAHASHYRGLGMKVMSYWSEEFSEMLNGWIEVIASGEKAEDNCYNDGKSERVCFIESWGYFFGDYLMYKHFKEIFFNTYKNKLLYTSHAEYPYFYNQAYYSLLQKGYTIKDIFSIYKKSNIYSAKSFIDEFAKLHNLSTEEKEEIVNIFKERGADL